MTLEPQPRMFSIRVYLRQPQGRMIRMKERVSEAELASLMSNLQGWTQGYINGDSNAGHHVVVPVTNIAYIEAVPV